MDCVKAAEASIKVLLDDLTQETAALIWEAHAEYDGMYSISYLSMLFYDLFLVSTRVYIPISIQSEVSFSIFQLYLPMQSCTISCP